MRNRKAVKAPMQIKRNQRNGADEAEFNQRTVESHCFLPDSIQILEFACIPTNHWAVPGCYTGITQSQKQQSRMTRLSC
jgi:hypothetical protein